MIKEHDENYYNWYNSLKESKKEVIDNYFNQLADLINLPKKDYTKMINDFEKAVLYYSNKNISIEKALKYLSLNNLETFYKEEPTYWYPLDYAAKIYPLSMSENWMAVFRESMYLKQNVIPEILQIALTFTIKRFPYYATSINRGFFWHYLDSSVKRYYVSEEHHCPCSPMNVSNAGSPTFRVYYYKNRVSVEFFHILTDGHGASIFLKTLIAEYIRLLGDDIDNTNGVLDINEEPKKEEARNDFVIPVNTKKTQGFMQKRSLQIDGKLSRIKPCQVLNFDIDNKSFLDLAHKKNVTVTTLMLGFIFMVCKYSTSKNGLISIQLPINMRKFYDSKTIRNFALYVNICIKRNEINDFDDLLKEVDHQIKEKTTQEFMEQFMKSTKKLVESLRFIPLFIKKPIAKVVYGFLGDKVFTTTLSNLGKVEAPKELADKIEKMDFVLGTTITNRAMFSLVTFGDVMTLSISKLTTNSALELNLYSLLLKEGITPKVYGSEIYENRK